MYKRILVATDGSELAMKAVRQGLALAKCLDATVTAVTVTDPWPAAEISAVISASPIKEYERLVAEEAGRRLAAVADLAAKQGVACNTLHVADRYPAEGIVEAARTGHCDLIVMASHGRRGISKLVLGSQATRVLAESPTPVLICK